MQLAANKSAHPQVNAIANKQLLDLKASWVSGAVHEQEMARRIEAFYTHPGQFEVPRAPKIPDGSPIGMACGF
jgi:hypothetical protein